MSASWWLGARSADAVNFKSMAANAKSMISSDAFQDSGDFVIAEFHKLLTLFADKVVMLWIAIIVFVNFTIVRSGNFTNQPGFFQ